MKSNRIVLLCFALLVLGMLGALQMREANNRSPGDASEPVVLVEVKKPKPVSIDDEGAVDKNEILVSDNKIVAAKSTTTIESPWGAVAALQCNARKLDLYVPRPDAPAHQAKCCSAVKGDIDFGRTMGHFISRRLCPESPLGRPARVMQVGANTGDNANDHLVKFLKLGVAHAVLLEPVPWIFKRLQATYKDYGSTVHLLNAAMSNADGNVTFTAPRESAKGWVPQMGGLSLPEKTQKKINKKGWGKYFEKLTVQSVTFESLLRMSNWHTKASAADTPLLDVFVVDAEGYDAVVMNNVLDAMESINGGTTNTAAMISIIQYEWKHLKEAAREELKTRLRGLGYCVVQAHYDDIAYMPTALRVDGGIDECPNSFAMSAASA